MIFNIFYISDVLKMCLNKEQRIEIILRVEVESNYLFATDLTGNMKRTPYTTLCYVWCSFWKVKKKTVRVTGQARYSRRGSANDEDATATIRLTFTQSLKKYRTVAWRNKCQQFEYQSHIKNKQMASMFSIWVKTTQTDEIMWRGINQIDWESKHFNHVLIY